MMSFRDKLNLYFIDNDYMPLFIQENYLSSLASNCSLNDIERMANSADYISIGDCVNN